MSYDAWKLDNGERPERQPASGYITADEWGDRVYEALGQLAKSLDAYDPEIDQDGNGIRIALGFTLANLEPAAQNWVEASGDVLPPESTDLRPDMVAALEAAIAAIQEDIRVRP